MEKDTQFHFLLPYGSFKCRSLQLSLQLQTLQRGLSTPLWEFPYPLSKLASIADTVCLSTPLWEFPEITNNRCKVREKHQPFYSLMGVSALGPIRLLVCAGRTIYLSTPLWEFQNGRCNYLQHERPLHSCFLLPYGSFRRCLLCSML